MRNLLSAAIVSAIALTLAAGPSSAAHTCTPACKKGEVCTMNSKGETRCKKQEIKGSEECKGDPLCGLQPNQSGGFSSKIRN